MVGSGAKGKKTKSRFASPHAVAMTVPPNVSGSKANPQYIAATIPLAGGRK
jgi:hypothetical protein